MNHDIMHCEGSTCPLKETCKRYLAHLEGVVYDRKYDTHLTLDDRVPLDGTCAEYWKVEDRHLIYSIIARYKTYIERQKRRLLYEKIADECRSSLDDIEKWFMDFYGINFGDKVAVDFGGYPKSGTYIFTGFAHEFNGNAINHYPLFAKIKKDGTASAQYVGTGWSVEFEHIKWLYKVTDNDETKDKE